MRRPAALVAALALALGLGGCLGSSVRDYVRDNYRVQDDEGGDRGSFVAISTKPPTETAKDIADARKPGDRRLTESGVFLRYADDYVGVVPDGKGGSRILVDDERRGYSHFYPFIGGYWGSYSRRGESFRGGGPGGGK